MRITQKTVAWLLALLLLVGLPAGLALGAAGAEETAAAGEADLAAAEAMEAEPAAEAMEEDPAAEAAKTAPAELSVTAPSAILMDAATGTVLWEQNADERRAPASVTKIMTLLLILEALDSGQIGWEDTVVASAAAAGKGGSQVFLEEGERMSMDEMLKSVVVSSANDCATALAEHLCGSEGAFVARMNQRAAELGMENTHFVNCTGLDDEPEAADHLTTARDIAIMSRELLKHEGIRKYTTIWTDSVRNGQFGLSNTNKLVRFYQGTTGLKTGYTSAAGHCLSASAERDGIELIAVVLGCGSSTDRFSDAKALLNWGFANFALTHPTLGVEPTPIPVRLGAAETVLPEPVDDSPILIRKSQQSAVARELSLEPALEAPVEKGQVVGTIRVTANGELLREIPLVAGEDVPRLTYGQIWLKLLQALAGG